MKVEAAGETQRNLSDLHGFAIQTAPTSAAIPEGFAKFYAPLHSRFTPWQQELIAKRKAVLKNSHAGRLPEYLPASAAITTDWKIALPDFVKDQRNQMTGPADDAELCVKMLNSGAPGV